MNKERFEVLANRHKDAVYRQMVRVCRHREDAEDALASALMLAYRSAAQLASDEAFPAWLATIGRRVCSKMRTSPGMAEVWRYAESLGFAAEEDASFDIQIMKGCVKDAVQNLPEILRTAYEMCDIDGRTDDEAAKRIGISIAALKGRLRRARAMVREKLDQSVCGSM